MATHLVGIDIGTQGTKAAVFTLEGTCVGSAFAPSHLLQSGPGRAEENPEEQYASVCDTIRRSLAQARLDAREIAAVGIAGQMAGVIGLGADGRAVTPYDSWLDTRCAPQIAVMNRKAGDLIVRKTGGPASFNHGPKILWWREEARRTWRTIRVFVQPSAYAGLRLCGLGAAAAFLDRTYLHFSGFADSRRAKWDQGLCDLFDLDVSRLPRLVESHEVIGQVADRSSGLRPGTPVIAGCGDTAASFLACGATRENICVDVAGTASVFAATTRRFLADRKHRTLACGRSAVPGLWHPYAYVNGGGMNLEWIRNSVTNRPLPELDALAAGLTAQESDPFFVPHLSGRVSPAEPGLRGSWAGLSLSHGPAHLYRAALEGVALEYGIYRDVLRGLDPDFQVSEIRVTGGGERSQVWNRIKAGVLGCPVVQVTRTEGAPMGCALLAAYGVGLVKDLDRSAQAWVGKGARTKSPHRETIHYARRLRRYRQLLDHLNSWANS